MATDGHERGRGSSKGRRGIVALAAIPAAAALMFAGWAVRGAESGTTLAVEPPGAGLQATPARAVAAEGGASAVDTAAIESCLTAVSDGADLTEVTTPLGSVGFELADGGLRISDVATADTVESSDETAGASAGVDLVHPDARQSIVVTMHRTSLSTEVTGDVGWVSLHYGALADLDVRVDGSSLALLDVATDGDRQFEVRASARQVEVILVAPDQPTVLVFLAPDGDGGFGATLVASCAETGAEASAATATGDGRGSGGDGTDSGDAGTDGDAAPAPGDDGTSDGTPTDGTPTDGTDGTDGDGGDDGGPIVIVDGDGTPGGDGADGADGGVSVVVEVPDLEIADLDSLLDVLADLDVDGLPNLDAMAGDLSLLDVDGDLGLGDDSLLDLDGDLGDGQPLAEVDADATADDSGDQPLTDLDADATVDDDGGDPLLDVDAGTTADGSGDAPLIDLDAGTTADGGGGDPLLDLDADTDASDDGQLPQLDADVSVGDDSSGLDAGLGAGGGGGDDLLDVDLGGVDDPVADLGVLPDLGDLLDVDLGEDDGPLGLG